MKGMPHRWNAVLFWFVTSLTAVGRGVVVRLVC